MHNLVGGKNSDLSSNTIFIKEKPDQFEHCSSMWIWLFAISLNSRRLVNRGYYRSTIGSTISWEDSSCNLNLNLRNVHINALLITLFTVFMISLTLSFFMEKTRKQNRTLSMPRKIQNKLETHGLFRVIPSKRLWS